MKTQMKFLAAAVALVAAGSSFAQTAGTKMVRIGATQLTPQVTSGDLTGVGANNKTDVGFDTQPSGGLTYMFTDNVALDLPVAAPFTHKLSGAGALAGVGKVGEVSVLPATLFVQYRLLEANAKIRPYVGLGLTYARFFNETGSGALTAMLNPGGPPTTFKVDSKFALTPQIGITFNDGGKWFVDISYSQTKLSTVTTMSTGNTQDIALDPKSVSFAIGFRF
ncbi:MAG: hypothetical protein RL710_1873 [Pseudomonadota bacterium]